MNTLIIESSSDACSIALKSNDQLYSDHIISQRKHNDLILPMIKELALQAEIKLTDLDEVYFGNGPGSFTGTRIGASIASGLAVAADAKLGSLSSFQLLAQGIYELFKFERVLIAVDARKNELYMAAYQHQNGIMLPVLAPGLIKPEALQTPDNAEWAATGDAWFRCFETIPAIENIKFERNAQNWLPRAEDGFALIDNNQSQVPEIAYLRNACDWKKWEPQA